MGHYKPTEGEAERITRDKLYLIDSGGQYWDGTTGQKILTYTEKKI